MPSLKVSGGKLVETGALGETEEHELNSPKRRPIDTEELNIVPCETLVWLSPVVMAVDDVGKRDLGVPGQVCTVQKWFAL